VQSFVLQPEKRSTRDLTNSEPGSIVIKKVKIKKNLINPVKNPT
jgi:hypothetical protein